MPVEKPQHLVVNGKGRRFDMNHHTAWDDKVHAITGGMTIHGTAKGKWVSPSGVEFREKMIPVRIACTRVQIMEIGYMTRAHYEQEQIMIVRISEEVIFIGAENGNQS